MPAPEALVSAAASYCLEHGLADMSLRPLAAALGTSDRMLVYHFGSKDGLVASVIDANARRLAVHLGEGDGPMPLARYVDRTWQRLTGPEGRRLVAFFLELHVLALRRGEPYRASAALVADAWRATTTARLASLGLAPKVAARGAELLVAAMDGLLLAHVAFAPDVAAKAPASLRVLAEFLAAQAEP
jgi:AcrR family transcriptional regulator